MDASGDRGARTTYRHRFGARALVPWGGALGGAEYRRGATHATRRHPATERVGMVRAHTRAHGFKPSFICPEIHTRRLIAATEIFTHLVVAAIGTELDYAFFVGLIVVVGIANLLPYLLTIVIWRVHRAPRTDDCFASPYWAVLEAATGVGLLFVLGGGFYIGPCLLVVDSLVRITEIVEAPVPPREDEIALGTLQEL